MSQETILHQTGLNQANTSTYILPLLEISKLSSPHIEDRLEIAKALDQACRDVGFLYLRGDQFQPELFKKLLKTTQEYFAQDFDQKMQNYIGFSQNHSGYVPAGEEQFSENSRDLKEAYDINYDYLGQQLKFPLLGPTQWPDNPIFKKNVLNYYNHLKDIGHQIFQAIALALGLDELHFEKHITQAPSQLRLIHYPYNPEACDHEGIGAHTDYECFTLLMPTAPGLQVLNKSGEWIDIPVLENTLVMNIGDMMEILSNGRWLATKHRVKKVREERYSFPLFFSCDYDYLIKPVIPNEVPRYKPLKGGEHLFNQTAQSFSYLKKQIATGELILENAHPLDSFGITESKEST